MKKLLLLASLMVLTNAVAVKSFAGELDDEKSVSNQELQGTVIVRVDTRDNSAAYVKSDSKISSDNDAQVVAKTSNYTPLTNNQVKSELDKDGGASSWYFYNNYNCGYYCNNSGYYNNYGYYNYNYSMNWYGNYYNPMYSYNYGYYQYYYYCQNRWW